MEIYLCYGPRPPPATPVDYLCSNMSCLSVSPCRLYILASSGITLHRGKSLTPPYPFSVYFVYTKLYIYYTNQFIFNLSLCLSIYLYICNCHCDFYLQTIRKARVLCCPAIYCVKIFKSIQSYGVCCPNVIPPLLCILRYFLNVSCM